MKKRTPLTDDQRAAKRTADQQLAREAVEQLLNSDGWRTWLTTRSRFHTYSFGNQLLIAMQHPTATRVAGFRRWLELGYCVRAGEHGIRIWAPCPPSKKAIAEALARGEERPRTHFRLAAVFAQDQIAELPPPAEPVPLTPPISDIDGDDLGEHIEPLIEFAATIGSEVSLSILASDFPGGEHGYYRLDNKQIAVNANLSINQQVKTLVHEIAHALVRADHHDDDPTLDRASEELLVESVAMSVCGTLGLDTTGYSIPYLASWSDGDAEHLDSIEAHAKLVNRLASRIEDAVARLEIPTPVAALDGPPADLGRRS
jgi:antirestriction protein ArdC